MGYVGHVGAERGGEVKMGSVDQGHDGYVATYRTVRLRENLIPWEMQKAADEFTDAITHMMRSDVSMTLDEIVANAKAYNSQWEESGGGCFMTDPLDIAEAIAYLASVGYVEVVLAKKGALD
jgi:hypothetical protein